MTVVCARSSEEWPSRYAAGHDDADGWVEDAGCAGTPASVVAERAAVHRAGWRAGQTMHRQPLPEALSASGLVGRHGGQKNCGLRERLLLSWLQ